MKKLPTYAGTFYPDNAHDLTELIKKFASGKPVCAKSKVIIVPHAGYQFSGHAMNIGYENLADEENIFIIAPSHHYDFLGIALPEYEKFETPFGTIDVNRDFINEIQDNFGAYVNNTPFEEEHSIEVQIPFIQHYAGNTKIINAANLMKGLRRVKIIPILTGKCEPKLIANLIERFYNRAAFVISTDLSHFHPDHIAKQTDNYTAWMIETGHIEQFSQEQACGGVGLQGIIEFSNKHNYSLIRLEMFNSGDITGDKSKVVGYGSWFLYEGKKETLISKYYSKYLIEECKKSILSGFAGEKYTPQRVPGVLQQYGASFVTLEITGHLRGCMGSIYSDKPLINDITSNAQSAAFFDPRFNPLIPEEFNNLTISISILSEPKKIEFKDEQDLLSKIYPYGIILAENDKKGVYLPIVWEQLKDRRAFLNSLKEKAGLYSNYFSTTMQVYKFETEYISSEYHY